MTFKEKMQHANAIASGILNGEDEQQLKQQLKDQGLKDLDVTLVMNTYPKILGDKLRPDIRRHLIGQIPLKYEGKFALVSREELKRQSKLEFDSLVSEQKNLVKEMLRKGYSHKDIYEAVDPNFYSKQQVHNQIHNHVAVKAHNSGENRLFNVFVGGFIMFIGIALTIATFGSGGGVVFYGLILAGLVMMIKGLITLSS